MAAETIIVSRPVRWYVACAVALVACVSTACQVPTPIAPPRPVIGATCEDAFAVLDMLHCPEALPGPDAARADGTVRPGATFVEVCRMAVEDRLPQVRRLGCVAGSKTVNDVRACGMKCR